MLPVCEQLTVCYIERGTAPRLSWYNYKLTTSHRDSFRRCYYLFISIYYDLSSSSIHHLWGMSVLTLALCARLSWLLDSF